jgi:hypothetical protein
VVRYLVGQGVIDSSGWLKAETVRGGGRALLTRQHRQEGLARAYVQAVAAACGVGYSIPNPDYGIDLTLEDILIRGQRRVPSGWKLDLQAKSTTLADIRGSHVKYDLEVRAYEVLRAPEARCPRILVVLVLPEDEDEWLAQTEGELILRRCAYWYSLRGRKRATRGKTVRLSVPRANVFSPVALREIMARLKEGGAP